MSPKKQSVLRFPRPDYRRELDQLHARRVAITSLIKSLEVYDRLRAKVIKHDGRKTA